MTISMDKAGRVVIPKSVRDELGLTPEIELAVTVEHGAVVLEPVARHRGFAVVDGLAVLDPVPDATLTDDDVRRLRLADQR